MKRSNIFGVELVGANLKSADTTKKIEKKIPGSNFPGIMGEQDYRSRGRTVRFQDVTGKENKMTIHKSERRSLL